MILATIDWLSISINLLLIVFVLVALLMSLVILMQRPKQEGLGAAFGSGMTDQVFGARTTGVLQKGTVYLGSLFFILTLTLAILYARKNERDYSSKLVKDPAPMEVTVPPVEEPASDATVPSSLEDSLEGVLPDAATTDESDMSPDAPAPDAPAPDAPTPDAPTPDAPTPDAPTPDAPAPDAPEPDAPAPDAPEPAEEAPPAVDGGQP